MNTDLHGDSNSMQFEIEEKLLHFKQPAGTSRGVYLTRKIWLIKLTDGDNREESRNQSRPMCNNPRTPYLI